MGLVTIHLLTLISHILILILIHLLCPEAMIGHLGAQPHLMLANNKPSDFGVVVLHTHPVPIILHSLILIQLLFTWDDYVRVVILLCDSVHGSRCL